VVAKRHQGGEEFKDHHERDNVDLFTYRVGYPVGARGRGGGRFAESEFNLFFAKGDG